MTGETPETEKSQEFDPTSPIRWLHRRRMAYIALIAILLVTFVIVIPIVPDTRLDKLSDLVVWFFITMGSIVGAYMGFATLTDMSWMKKK